MSSDDEKYLDSLLNSAQSNKDPQSALSRMSPKGKSDGDTFGSSNSGPEDIAELVDNANGNDDLNEIGNLLNDLDSGVAVDSKMADLLDGIESATNPSIPLFTVGNERSALDTRDPEEIALDEAIADAERLEAEIQSGKFNDATISDDKPAPLVDIEEGDDALMEMAPEVILPEDNVVTIENSGSDANETPEEILTDLLDDMPGDSLTSVPDESVQDSLNDVLDNMQETAEDLSASLDGMEDNTSNTLESIDTLDNIDNLSLEDIEKAIDAVGSSVPDTNSGGELVLEEPEVSEPSLEELSLEEPEVSEPSLEDFSMEEPKLPDTSLEEMALEEPSAENTEGIDEALASATVDESELNELSLDELSIEEPTAESDETSISEEDISKETISTDEAPDAALEEAATSEEGADESLDDLALEGFTLDGGEPSDDISLAEMEAQMAGMDDSALEESPEAPSEGPTTEASDNIEDEFSLDNMEASLDTLMGDEASVEDSTAGEVAEVSSADEALGENSDKSGDEDVDMSDLDALMNSLASDEIEDIESTAAQDEEAGVSEEEELPKEDILGALTEEGFDDGEAEPSLDELASIPERSRDDDEPEDNGKKGKKAKKDKKDKKGLGAFLSKLFHTLTDEDEENEGLASLTDENQTVLNELAGDEKPKKEKKKKEKKPKKEKPPKEKKPKKEKPPKPKKEKKPKPPKNPGVPEKAMSPKKIAISGIFAASIGIFFMIPVLVLPDRIANEKAATAYTHKEYTTAYKMLYGKERTEDQTVIYEQSRVLAWAERYLAGYENYVAMNMEEEALDMLLMGMRNKGDLLEEAAKFNVEIQVQSVYDNIESLLSTNYGLTESDISEINSIKKERDYTIRLMEIVGTL
ncbi:hypothetical protein [Butyrivibrio proteoclasticus]|uniref:hypothetical protein n=1 Tax=Butyrivibrio proteoclasticus TaxID=43305 RepID=UPI0004789BF3|nr:hypothetical protein [Butyrivibrio proteoclasticus]